jgi:hypothetical protein
VFQYLIPKKKDAQTYNLKKLLKFSREKVKIKAAEMRQKVGKAIY